ncbi:MAG: tetratricopeptide repeat protein [Candidatus Omnitrophica bacterium]|nr:tetratricopeptide repeat protein [Candidatus Omnitrophota bacterium]
MNHPDFTQLRRDLDRAITFGEETRARDIATQGLKLARERACPGEECYFSAQFDILSGDCAKALLRLEQALVHNPADGAAYNDIALCRLELGQVDGTLDVFDRGIAVEEDYATIHHNKGWFLHNLGQDEAALQCFRRALELEPDRAVTCENLASVCENLGRYSEAVEYYRQAVRLLGDGADDIRSQLEAAIRRLDKS